MTAPDPARKLAGLIRRLKSEYGDARVESAPGGGPAAPDPVVAELVFSYLTWEASTAKAASGLKRLSAAVVDCNELRVCLPDELARILGERYPRAEERASRLRSTLNDIYRREHRVRLDHLPGIPKRDAWQYLCTLGGMPTFVAARITLLSLGGHAFPVDSRLKASLEEEGVAIPQDDPDGASGWLERQFRAGEVTEPYLLLEAWMNDRAAPKPSKVPAAAKARSDGPPAKSAPRKPGKA